MNSPNFDSRNIFAVCIDSNLNLAFAADDTGRVAAWDLQVALSRSSSQSSHAAGTSVSIEPSCSAVLESCDIFCLDYDSCSRSLLVGSDEGLSVWRHHGGGKLSLASKLTLPLAAASRRGTTGPVSEVNAVATESSGRILAALGDGRLAVVDVANSSAVNYFQIGGEFSPARSIASLPSRNQVAVGYENGTVRLWDTRSSTVAASAVLASSVNCLSADSAANWVACGSSNKTVSLLPLSCFEVAVAMPAVAPVNAVLLLDDQVLSAGDDGAVSVWRRGTGEPLGRLVSSSRTIFDLASVKDGAILLAAGSSSSVDVFLNQSASSVALRFRGTSTVQTSETIALFD